MVVLWQKNYTDHDVLLTLKKFDLIMVQIHG